MPHVPCLQCQSVFYARPSLRSAGQGTYCSRTCHHEAMRRGISTRCAVCGKEVHRSPVDVQRSKSGKFFCGKSCQTVWRNKRYAGEKHLQWKGGAHRQYRNVLAATETLRVCTRCGCNDVRVLVVHHLDRDRRHNSVDNLVWLCQNCHYLIHHDREEDKCFMAALV